MLGLRDSTGGGDVHDIMGAMDRENRPRKSSRLTALRSTWPCSEKPASTGTNIPGCQNKLRLGLSSESSRSRSLEETTIPACGANKARLTGGRWTGSSSPFILFLFSFFGTIPLSSARGPGSFRPRQIGTSPGLPTRTHEEAINGTRPNATCTLHGV